jgi:hypothetical protein
LAACCCCDESLDLFALWTAVRKGESLSIGPVRLSQEKSIGEAFDLNAMRAGGGGSERVEKGERKLSCG